MSQAALEGVPAWNPLKGFTAFISQMRLMIDRAAVVLLGMSAWLVSLRTPQTDLPRVTIQVGDSQRQIEVQLATTPAQIAKGLMFTRSLKPDEGMLFKFDGGNAQRCMWMKNTPIPLSLAFIAADGSIREVLDASANSRTILCVDGVQMVLEMRDGWFRANDLQPGSRIEIGRKTGR